MFPRGNPPPAPATAPVTVTVRPNSPYKSTGTTSVDLLRQLRGSGPYKAPKTPSTVVKEDPGHSHQTESLQTKPLPTETSVYNPLPPVPSSQGSSHVAPTWYEQEVPVEASESTGGQSVPLVDVDTSKAHEYYDASPPAKTPRRTLFTGSTPPLASTSPREKPAIASQP